ncbi:MAG: NUDIX hydrolase [Deltaproteobacteria bacterium]|nr:NUDIX hydrolase [Deltaproteobacteria bacterium]
MARYRAEAFPRPSVAVDLVILTIVDCELRVLLVERKEHPFRGEWALPGGFLRVGAKRGDFGEDLDAAAERELREETGLSSGVYLEQLYTFGKANRDPRTRVLSVAHYALVRPDLVPLVRPGGDVGEVAWHEARRPPRLAFDHREILQTALARIRGKIDYTDIAFELVPPTFTIQELRAVHEVVKGAHQDPGNFRKRFERMVEDGLIERAPGKRLTASKPARVYRFRRE